MWNYIFDQAISHVSWHYFWGSASWAVSLHLALYTKASCLCLLMSFVQICQISVLSVGRLSETYFLSLWTKLATISRCPSLEHLAQRHLMKNHCYWAYQNCCAWLVWWAISYSAHSSSWVLMYSSSSIICGELMQCISEVKSWTEWTSIYSAPKKVNESETY